MVIELAYFEECTQSEIAQRCHIPLGTVKARIRLGMLHLRQVLEQQRGDERFSLCSTTKEQARASQAAIVVVQVMEGGCAAGYEMNYEALLNPLIQKYSGVTIVCLYDLRRFEAPTMLNLLLTHPTVHIPAGRVPGYYSL